MKQWNVSCQVEPMERVITVLHHYVCVYVYKIDSEVSTTSTHIVLIFSRNEIPTGKWFGAVAAGGLVDELTWFLIP